MNTESNELSNTIPSSACMNHAFQLAINDDRPIHMDYWSYSCNKQALIGVRESGEKLLVKSEDEYTSPIVKVYKVGEEFIILTENSIYIVKNDIPTKRIS